MSACLLIGGKAVALAASLFTLSWTHSAQKSEWQEDWRIDNGRLQLIEARIKGSGAGMEPGEGAVLVGGWLRWKPEQTPLHSLTLARSGATQGPWRLCSGPKCHSLAGHGPLQIKPCGKT